LPADFAETDSQVPVYPFPEQAARALRKAVQYAEWRVHPIGTVPEFADIDADLARSAMDRALDQVGPDGGWMETDEISSLLGAYGLRLPKAAVAMTADEAAEIAATFSGPAVLKVIADSAVHKSDVGGVVLDVQGDDAIRKAFSDVTQAVPDAAGAMVQEFVGGGHEVLIGMTQDPSFGPLIVFGLGGVFVELIGDVAFRIHPLTDVDVEEMIGQVRSSKLLDGYRGGEPGDVEAVKEALLRVSTLVEDFPEIAEMDLNPVKVARPGEGLSVVDARIRIERVPRTWIPEPALRPAPPRRRGLPE
jgi:acyl-CoA synthetase (NDP forming)